MANNILQQVATYNEVNLALLQNLCCVLSLCNTKFKNFDKSEPANLGATINFDRRPRFRTTNSLVITKESAQQRVLSLTVDQQASTAFDFTASQFLYNIHADFGSADVNSIQMGYLKKFGESAVAEIGSQIESNISEVFKTQTYRFFGDGTTDISTYLQLANAVARFKNFGSAPNNIVGILPDTTYPKVVNNGLGQFALDRNNEEAMTWMVGEFAGCTWYKSNLLPTHTAGAVGQAGSTLTVVSTTKNSEGQITSITFSGAGTSVSDAILQDDRFEFQDGVSGQPNIRFVTFIGHKRSANPVQFRATANAGSNGSGQVTVTCDPPLDPTASQNQNITTDIVAGMQAKVMPNHASGVIMSGDPLFMAMPKLPSMDPYKSAETMDPETGVSLRQYYGATYGQNEYGMVIDAIWGKRLESDYAMAFIVPEA